jgi:hypothetical protein
MGGFPALPSGNNPYAGAAAGYANAAASVYNNLQSRLQQAANQQAAAMRQKDQDIAAARQRDFENQLELYKAGGQLQGPGGGTVAPQQNSRTGTRDAVTLRRPDDPSDVPAEAPASNAPTPGASTPGTPIPGTAPAGGLMASLGIAAPPLAGPSDPSAPAAAPAGQTAAPVKQKGQTITAPGGNNYYFPTPAEKLDDTNSIVAPAGSETEKMLQQVAGVQPGTRIPHSLADTVTALARQLQSSADDARKAKQVGVVNKAAAQKFHALGIDVGEGTEVPVGELNKLFELLTPKEETQVALPGFAGPTGAPLVRGDKSGKAQEVVLPPGSKPALTEEQRVRKQEFDENAAQRAESRAARTQAESTRVANELAKHNEDLVKGKRTAKEDFLNALGKAPDDDARLAAARTYKNDLDQVQATYDTNYATTLKKPTDRNKWAQKLDPVQLIHDAGEKLDSERKAGGQAPSKNDPAGVRKPKPDPLGVRP